MTAGCPRSPISNRIHSRPGKVAEARPEVFGKNPAVGDEGADRAGTARVATSLWSHHTSVSSDGLCIRVASSRRDAAGIRDVLHSAWQVSEDEDYFYQTFNDPEAIYRAFIEPSLSCADLRSLDVLCLIGEQADGRIVATFSLILDHDCRTVELGRGAVASDCQGQAVLCRFAAISRAILDQLDDYSVVADVTTLARGATRFALICGSQPVALHPSSFVIQPSCVDSWLDRLRARHGDTAGALLWRSERSRLGRFATAWHMTATTAGEPREPAFRPHLCRHQRRFFEHTCDVLDLARDLAGEARDSAVEQPVSANPERVADNSATWTRTIIDPAPHSDPRRMVDSAARDGFETVIVQVPCDRENQLLCRRLARSGALLSGVFPMPSGHWYASYTLLVGAEHREQVLDNLVEIAGNGSFDPAYHRLLDLMLAANAEDRVESSATIRLLGLDSAA